MKKITQALVFVFISGLISFVPASAEECSPQNPCMTYAEVDANGKVINAIVCQPSVCDAMWGGKHPDSGNKLVPQLSADSNGNPRGGHNSTPTVDVTESQGTFTIKDNVTNSVTTLKKPDISTDVSATVSGQTAKVDANKNDVSVNKDFEEKVTEEEFTTTMTDPFSWDFSQLNLINDALNIWLAMLDEWFLQNLNEAINS